MKESRYNMYMKNVETLDTNMDTIVQQQASQKKEPQGPIPIFAWGPQFKKSAPGNVYKVIVSQMKASTLNHWNY